MELAAFNQRTKHETHFLSVFVSAYRGVYRTARTYVIA